ncbi:EAL domain-containing protein [Paenibacillus protaetiae]|uniref:EAL domain-containing protein n=1 Tax=Paenibacillus protaetiae TaxID=2509456 RepID=A0A4P6EXT0_9BACL|nr:EAL domain-containing protein [Paenibacillus protaetiae]QAY66559.1 EAL domain-containing protein [Paenibacillus protaetiae]
MEHLRSIINREQQGPAGERLGILYFAWQQAEGSDYPAWTNVFESWQNYAENSIDGCPELAQLRVRVYWLHHDLFLFVALPHHDLEQTERRLFELTLQLRNQWQHAFTNLVPASEWPGGAGGAGFVLHGGAAVIGTLDETGDGEDQVYMALKQAIIQGQKRGSLERSLRRKALDQMLAEQSIRSVYQPIRSLKEGGIFGYEALTRCPDTQWFDGPLDLFTFAEEEGIGYALDRLAREKAIGLGDRLGGGQKLFINLLAQIMEEPDLLPGRTLAILEQHGLTPSNVVFEITERSSINDFSAVKKALDHYRRQGYRIAIDDVGAGYSSLQSIVELRPDYIKVDRSIIRNIHLDELKEHTLFTLQELAKKMGIALIAEGIEREEELRKVQEMGIPFGQGYLLGRPAAME